MTQRTSGQLCHVVSRSDPTWLVLTMLMLHSTARAHVQVIREGHVDLQKQAGDAP